MRVNERHGRPVFFDVAAHVRRPRASVGAWVRTPLGARGRGSRYGVAWAFGHARMRRIAGLGGDGLDDAVIGMIRMITVSAMIMLSVLNIFR